MWRKRNEEGDFLQQSHKDFRTVVFQFSPQNFITCVLKIKMYNKCFSTVCNEKPSRLTWAACVTESLFFFPLEEKLVTRESSIQPVPLRTCSGTRQTLTHRVHHVESDSPIALLLQRVHGLKCRKTSSTSYASGSFVSLQALFILAAHCFLVLPVTGDAPVRLTQLNQGLVWRYVLMFETLKALLLSLSCRSVQWPRQLLRPGNHQLWS